MILVMRKQLLGTQAVEMAAAGAQFRKDDLARDGMTIIEIDDL
nr:hypothetical protein [Bradyrhizobium diazoefficiens]